MGSKLKAVKRKFQSICALCREIEDQVTRSRESDSHTNMHNCAVSQSGKKRKRNAVIRDVYLKRPGGSRFLLNNTKKREAIGKTATDLLQEVSTQSDESHCYILKALLRSHVYDP